MTNLDRIRSMTEEELVDFLLYDRFYSLDGCCDDCDITVGDDGTEFCKQCYMDWLKEEVKK